MLRQISIAGIILCLPLLAAPAELDGDTFLFRRRFVPIAQPCRVIQHAQVIQAPIVHHAHAVQKIITYGQHAIVTPVAIEQPTYVQAPVYYWSVTEAYQQRAMLREILREELRNLGTMPAQPAQPVTPQQLQRQPAVEARPNQPAAWTVDDVTPADLQKENLAAFQAGCVRCHGATSKIEGGLRLVLAQPDGSYALTKLSADKRWKIYAMASVGAMPPEAAVDANKALPSKFLQALLKRATIKD